MLLCQHKNYNDDLSSASKFHLSIFRALHLEIQSCSRYQTKDTAKASQRYISYGLIIPHRGIFTV